jgi:hypothetical protein
MGRDELLSGRMDSRYRRFNVDFGVIAQKAGLPFRLEETNSFYNGGAKQVSDTFASALWGLDYMWWWARHGCNGLNFHTGNWVAAGPELTRCRYAVFWTTTRGIAVHPLGYAMKAFDLAAHGRFVAAKVSSPVPVNLTAYGCLAANGSLYVTLINKTHGENARAIQAAVRAGSQYVHAADMTLQSPNNQAAAQEGVTLGGAAFTTNGHWTGRWHRLPPPGPTGVCPVRITATSALIIRLTPVQAARR